MLDLQLEKMRDQNKGNFQEIFSNTVAKVGSNVQANDLSLQLLVVIKRQLNQLKVNLLE